MEIARELIANFARISGADGGKLQLIEARGSRIRLGYTPGTSENCDSGVCTLPPAELEDMMRAWLSRRAPEVELAIEPLKG